jgi:hypothetical protein
VEGVVNCGRFACEHNGPGTYAHTEAKVGQARANHLNEFFCGDHGKINGMNLDPRALVGEVLAGACSKGQIVADSVAENAAIQIGNWINETTSKTLGFGRASLTDRMQIMGLGARVDGFSFGGATKLMTCADGVVALPLARDTDIEMLPALFEEEAPTGVLSDVKRRWEWVERLMQTRSTNTLRERTELLGIPLAIVGETAMPSVTAPAIIPEFFSPFVEPSLSDLRVLELAPMWAGPLAGKILGAAGAAVVKVESPSRPDGTRVGSPEFFEYLNAGKEIVPLEFNARDAASHLRQLISSSDVVIEGSRPRALAQLGIDPREMLKSGHGAIWLSVTGYGRHSARVAFGDDAAAAGGLCDREALAFTGDASGDPLTGLAGAFAVLRALSEGRRCLLDLSMARVCAWAAHGA